MTKKMKPMLAWVGVMDNGKFEPADGADKAVPFLYPTKRRAKVALPSNWRIARVRITEAKP